MSSARASLWDAAACAAAAVYQDRPVGAAVPRLPDYYISDCFDCSTEQTGFQAALLRCDATGTVIVAFRGSDEHLDLAAGINLGLCQYGANRDNLLDIVMSLNASRVLVCGHSLGGALAQYCAYDLMMRGRVSARRELSLVTFNGVGGVAGLRRLHGSVDPDIRTSLEAVHFAHPDDIVVDIGGNLGSQIHLLPEADPGPASLLKCHGMDNFLPAQDGQSRLTGLEARPDRPLRLDRTADIIGPQLCRLILEWMGGRRVAATFGFIRLLPRIPFDERRDALRLISALSSIRSTWSAFER
ncbi:lipase family protein [Roseovarius sp. D0-M9]|uniref:lipase family protein n=1 Tax=Roseovarius sp. D0-M9 TaxID=3127117 RepID=UPI0030100C6B